MLFMIEVNQKQTNAFFTRGRHQDLEVYQLTQATFDLPKTTIGNNSKLVSFFTNSER